MRRWTLDGLAVVEYGDPDRPAVVLAHGVGSTAEFLARCVAGPLGAAGLRLVSYDLRGHGESVPEPDPAGHALGVHAADLAAVVAATGARVAGGLSLGAHAAIRADLTIDRLLLALPGDLEATAAANLATARELAAYGVAAALARIAAEPSVPRWVVGELRRSWPRHDPASLVAAFTAVAREATAPLPAGVPATVVTVPDDPAHPPAYPPTATTTMADWAADLAAIGRALLTGSR